MHNTEHQQRGEKRQAGAQGFPKKKLTTRRVRRSVFLPNSQKAVTATADGDAVLWDCIEQGPGEPTTERRASKVVRLHSAAVNCASAQLSTLRALSLRRAPRRRHRCGASAAT